MFHKNMSISSRFNSHLKKYAMAKARPRKKPKQQRSKATVAAIVEATTQLLVKEGFHNLSTNRIAEAAGVSVGSLYQYFPNKESVVAAVVEAFADREFERLAEQLASFDPDTTLEEGIYRVINAMFEAKKREPELSKVLFEELPPIGQLDILKLWTERSVEVVKIALALRSDEVRDLDPEIASYVIVTACHGIVHTTVVNNPELFQTDALARETTELLLRYIR